MSTRVALTLVAVAVLAGSRAEAMTVDYDFSAIVTEAMGSLPFGVGDTITGSFTYATDLDVKSAAGDTTIYQGGGILAMTVAGFTPGGNLNELLVMDGTSDAFEIRSSSIFDSTRLSLVDPTGSAFVSQAIPTSLPLSAFSEATFELDLAGFGLFAGEIFEASMPVPEPGTGALLGLGLAALALRRRR